MPQLTTRSRGDLKTFFVKNAIPTESNFADLIDGMLNQQDDGIAKLPNDALMIVAAGDATSQKKAIHFYAAAGDTDPSWTLSLNPRQSPADAASAKPGFSISDGAGNSRLFIERATGEIGIGTVTPQKKFHVQGATSGPFITDANDRPAIVVTGFYPELALFSNVNNPNHGPAIRLGSYTDATATAFKHWVIGTAGRNASFLDIGYSDRNDPNPHAGIRNYNGRTMLTLKENGTIGIGTTDPITDLTIRRDAAGALGPVITLMNAAGSPGAGGAIDFDGYNVGTNLPTLRVQSLDDGNFSSHLSISTKNSGAAANPLVERVRITSDGLLRFSNDAPKDKIVIYDNGGLDRYGLGLNGGNINLFCPQGARFSLRKSSSTGDEVFSVSGTGAVTFTGPITPSVGNSSARGIQFPSDPGGGGGDEAFIRYYPVSGESCKLLIGINNDADDTIGFWQAGAERMTVGFGYVDVVANANPIRFTSAWSGFPDGATNHAEISNDTGTYKTLMIIGNKSAGHERRVAVWDRLDVHGQIWVNDVLRLDLAEVTRVRADDQLEQGDIVVIDREDGTRVRRSAQAFDPAVYGVVSSYAQAAMVIGGFGGPEQMTQAPDRRPIALVGRVKIKVCSEAGPIRVGDLLTSSSRPGHAMRCADPAAHPGAIAGKALEPFSGDAGTITALVTLQ
jgi:hypothetical protein